MQKIKETVSKKHAYKYIEFMIAYKKLRNKQEKKQITKSQIERTKSKNIIQFQPRKEASLMLTHTDTFVCRTIYGKQHT